MSVAIDMCFCTRNEVDALFSDGTSHSTIKAFIDSKLVECSDDRRRLCMDGDTDSYANGIAHSLYILQHLTNRADIVPGCILYSMDAHDIMSFVDDMSKSAKASLNAPYTYNSAEHSKTVCESFWFFKKVCDWMLKHKDDLLVLYVY